MMERQEYLDLLARGCDPASGRRMVFGRLPVRPREADFMSAVADLAEDKVTFVGTRSDLAAAMDVSTKTIDRYASAVSAAGFLAKSRVGNRSRFELLIGAIIDGPKAMDNPMSIAPKPSAPKRSTVDSDGQRATSIVVETRQQIATRLVRTCAEVVTLVVALVFYSRYVRRTAKPVLAVRSGDAWQGLLFEVEPSSAPVQPLAPATPKSTLTVDTRRTETTAPHDHEMKNEMIHEACASDSGKSQTGGWPFNLSGPVLRDPSKVTELYRHACSRGWIQDSEATRLGFEAAAEQAATKGKHPGRLFSHLVKTKAWERSSQSGGITQKAEQAAAARRKRGAIRPTVDLPFFRDPDAAIAANRDAQAKALMERYGGAAQPSPRTRNAELVAG